MTRNPNGPDHEPLDLRTWIIEIAERYAEDPEEAERAIDLLATLFPDEAQWLREGLHEECQRASITVPWVLAIARRAKFDLGNAERSMKLFAAIFGEPAMQRLGVEIEAERRRRAEDGQI
jgi:hypothetical protein